MKAKEPPLAIEAITLARFEQDMSHFDPGFQRNPSLNRQNLLQSTDFSVYL